MKRFNTIVNTQLLKLLEALPQDGGPVIDQDPTSPDQAQRNTPQEKSNWEITLLDLAKTAIYNVKNDPESLAPEDEEKLGISVTSENKEEMLDLLYKLAGKDKAATMPLPPEPEEPSAPEPEMSPEPEPEIKPRPSKLSSKAARSSKPI